MNLCVGYARATLQEPTDRQPIIFQTFLRPDRGRGWGIRARLEIL